MSGVRAIAERFGNVIVGAICWVERLINAVAWNIALWIKPELKERKTNSLVGAREVERFDEAKKRAEMRQLERDFAQRDVPYDPKEDPFDGEETDY